jgi:hypothetical protein
MADDKVVPNSMKTASEAFTAGLYENSVVGVVWDGKLRLGIRSLNASENDRWSIWDNFRLTYLGMEAEPVAECYDKTIAEVENLDYIPMAEGLDIGAVLNKKTIAASYIYQMLLDASVRGVHNLTSADAEIVEFYAKEGSSITRHKVRNLNLPDEANIGGIVRAGEGILVNGETQIIAGDLVVVFCKSHVIRQLERFFK